MPVLIKTIMDAVPRLMTVAGLCGFVLLIFGIVGVELFKGSLHYHCVGADVDELEMKKFDRKRFVSTFLAETPHHHEVPSESSSKPHHGVASSKEPETNTVGGFSFEDGKHAMFSYQWDSQAEVISVREYFASSGIPTWMV